MLVAVAVALLLPLTRALPPCTNAHLAASFPRTGATYDEKYAKKNIYRQKGNDEHKAQFKEDIVMYEKYFFGKKNGVIMESGALDGDLYSTSYMFEKHFDWKSIHIGTALHLRFHGFEICVVNIWYHFSFLPGILIMDVYVLFNL